MPVARSTRETTASMRHLRKLCFILPTSFFLLWILNGVHHNKTKVKVVCRLDKQWAETSEAVKNITRQLVWSHFPYAEYEPFKPSSEIKIVTDKRNEAMAEKGYFVIGYDNRGQNSTIPSGYDFYVKFSDDQQGSHFFLKPILIQKAIEGCQKQVKFVYKDHDVILKNEILKKGFHPFKLAYQAEFHNSSANAGFVLGKCSTKVKYLVSLWTGGEGIGFNLEQDQTVLRALIAEKTDDFFSLPPNSAARHVYSVSKHRDFTLLKTGIIQSKTMAFLKHTITILVFIMSLSVLFSQHLKEEAYFPSEKQIEKLTFYMSVKSFLFMAFIYVVDRYVRNPLEIAQAMGDPILLDLGNYHSAHQLQSDDLVRVWRNEKGLHMGSLRSTYKLYDIIFLSPPLIVQILDFAYFISQLIPFTWIFLNYSLVYSYLIQRNNNKSHRKFRLS